MASKILLIFTVIISILILSIVGYSIYSSFLPTITKLPVTVNAYWLNTNITLGGSVTLVVKAVNSNFTAQIWKANTSPPDKLVAQYKGFGLLSQSFTPSERLTYYIKVTLLDGTVWEQQMEYRLKVG